MEQPIPEHFVPMIQQALGEMNVQQRIATATAHAAAKEMGLDGKPWKLSSDGKNLIVEA